MKEDWTSAYRTSGEGLSELVHEFALLASIAKREEMRFVEMGAIEQMRDGSIVDSTSPGPRWIVAEV